MGVCSSLFSCLYNSASVRLDLLVVFISRLNLNGPWSVKNLNGSVSVVGNVPGEIHTDLMRAGILGDPYYRYNDFELGFPILVIS